MKEKLTNGLLTLVALVLLAAFAIAIPQPTISQEAQKTYRDEAPAEDDEYAFLFE